MRGNSRAARTGREQEAKENQSTPKLAKVPGLELSRLKHVWKEKKEKQ